MSIFVTQSSSSVSVNPDSKLEELLSMNSNLENGYKNAPFLITNATERFPNFKQ